MLAAGVVEGVPSSVRGGLTEKSASQAGKSELPKEKQTTLGLYLTAKEAYDKWKADPEKVKILDVRTSEEYLFVGHPAMAWNIPLVFQTYQWDANKRKLPMKPNPDFVSQVKTVIKPTDILLVMCRSGGAVRWPSTNLPRRDSGTFTTSSMAWRETWLRIPEASSKARG